MSSFLVGWWDSVLVRQWVSGTVRAAVGFRLSAFRRKELRGVLKIGLKELTPLSSVAYGDTPLPEEGGFSSTSCSICDTKGKHVTQAIYCGAAATTTLAAAGCVKL